MESEKKKKVKKEEGWRGEFSKPTANAKFKFVIILFSVSYTTSLLFADRMMTAL